MSSDTMSTPRHKTLYQEQRTPQSQRREPPPMTRMTYTPCTRLSRLTIGSQTNVRTKVFSYERPSTNFNERLLEAVREDDQDHPNLTMVLGQDKISFDHYNAMDNATGGSSLSFQSDEDSDIADSVGAFSPGQFSPPSRTFTRSSIFDEDDEQPQRQTSSSPVSFLDERQQKKSIFDDDYHPMLLTDDDVVDDDDSVADKYFDPTNSWVTHIYCDTEDADVEDTTTEAQAGPSNAHGQENSPPCATSGRRLRDFDDTKKIRRFLPHEENNEVTIRLPLQEIRLEDDEDDSCKGDSPARKKFVFDNKPHLVASSSSLASSSSSSSLSSSSSSASSCSSSSAAASSLPKPKMRFMRSLSPKRDTRRKDKQQSSEFTFIL